jgi:antitoxin Phd
MSRRRAHAKPPRVPSGGASVSATEAQNNFGRVLGQAASEGAVFITRYDQPTAVVLSMDRYRALTKSDGQDLDEVTREFDEMVARMQTSGAKTAVDALFDMDAGAIGKAAAIQGASRRRE